MRVAASMARLLDDRELADRLGAAARTRVHDQFLGDRHLAQYVELFEASARRYRSEPPRRCSARQLGGDH